MRPVLLGLEYQKGPYIGRYLERLPECMEKTLEALKPVLTDLDYRGAISIEERLVSKDKSYLIDPCCRMPFPLSAVYTESIINYSDLIWNIASKKPVSLKPAGKYAMVLPLESHEAKDSFVELKVPESERKTVKFRTACKVGKNYYAVKGLNCVVVLIAVGDNIEKMIEDIEEAADKLDIYDLDTDAVGGLHHCYENIEKIRKAGIEF